MCQAAAQADAGEVGLSDGRDVIGVFGANSFIGRNLVRRLAAEGRRAIAFGRAFPRDFFDFVGPQIETRTLEFTDTLTAHAALHGLTQVVQLVNSSSPGLGNSRPVADLQANVLPHVSFIESCILTGVERFLFLSSGGTVYGDPAYLPIDEAHPTVPISSYGLTKLIVEKYVEMLARSTAMSYVTLRASNPFGPGQTLRKGQGLVASVLRSHRFGQPVTVYGDGSVQRDYLYIDDLCDAVLAALDGPAMHETVNIGSGVGRSVLEVVHAVEAALGDTVAIEFAPARPTDTKANVLDCAKAAALLGWHPRTGFEEALARTAAAF